MKRCIFVLLFMFAATVLWGQDADRISQNNLDLQRLTPDRSWGERWRRWGEAYTMRIDSTVRYQDKNVILVEPVVGNRTGMSGYAVCPIRVSDIKAKVITLKGRLKYEDVQHGYVGLYIRIDGKAGEHLVFDNMSQKKLDGTSDWREFTMSHAFPADAAVVFVGAIHSGTGKVWACDFQLLFDDKDLNHTEKRPLLKADTDTAFNRGSGIGRIDLTLARIESLKKLGLVWGFLKYYHPAIARGDYNWDNELFRLLPGYLEAVNPAQQDRLLANWIDGLGAFETQKTDFAPKTAKLIPDLGWIDSAGLLPELQSRLLKVKEAQRTGDNYYGGRLQNFPAPMAQSRDNGYPEMKYPDAGFRLLGLYRYWNFVQYFFPYRYLIGEDWKNVLAEFIPKFLVAGGETEYTLAAVELIGRIHDGHGQVLNYEPYERYLGSRCPAAWVTFVGDTAVVGGFCPVKGVQTEQSGLRPGDIITRIGGVPVADLCAKQMKYIAASNRGSALSGMSSRLLRTDDTVLRLEYCRDGRILSETATTYPLGRVNRRARFGRPDTCLREVAPGIVHLRVVGLSRAQVPDLMDKVLDMGLKGLIIDLREYPMALDNIGNYLLSKPAEYARFSFLDEKIPGLFNTVPNPDRFGKAGMKRYFEGKVAILINEQTVSSGEIHAMAFRLAPGAVLVGSPTAGADGNVTGSILFPGGLASAFSGIGVYYPDGRETQRIGIQSDVEVRPTVAGIRAGRDEVLEKAAAILSE